MTTLNKALEIKKLQDSIVSFNSQINFKQNEIDYLKREQQALEVDPDDYICDYEDMLNESGDVNIAGYDFAPAYALKQLDDIAYREGLNNYADAAYSIEDLGEYKEMDEKIENLENQISDLLDQITEAEEEIEALKEKE